MQNVKPLAPISGLADVYAHCSVVVRGLGVRRPACDTDQRAIVPLCCAGGRNAHAIPALRDLGYMPLGMNLKAPPTRLCGDELSLSGDCEKARYQSCDNGADCMGSACACRLESQRLCAFPTWDLPRGLLEGSCWRGCGHDGVAAVSSAQLHFSSQHRNLFAPRLTRLCMDPKVRRSTHRAGRSTTEPWRSHCAHELGRITTFQILGRLSRLQIHASSAEHRQYFVSGLYCGVAKS